MKGFSNLANIGQKLLWHGKLWPQVFLPYTNLLHLGTRFKKWPVPNIIFINFEISHNETSFGFNDIHSHGKTVFCSIQYKNGGFWPFWCVYWQSVKFYYTFYYYVLWIQMFEKCDYGYYFQQVLRQNLSWFLS